jgi:hypothetical protein
MKRRHFLRNLTLGAAAASSGGALSSWLTGPRMARAENSERRYLFVITATGGASIVDSFLPVLSSQVSTPERAARLIAYPESYIAQPNGSELRCVRNLRIPAPFQNDYDLTSFLSTHARDLAVVTADTTSVNHGVAQKRAVTGAGIDAGRTIMEAAALRHGEGLLLPNVNLAQGGYLEPGDADVPDRVRAEAVARAELFAVATHGYRGIPRAPAAGVIERARAARERLEGLSPRAGQKSALRDRYLSLRTEVATKLEHADLITKLMLLQNGADLPLDDYGLAQSPDGPLLREVLPRIGVDRLQTQTALAFLLVKYGVSCAVTFGPGAVPSFLPDGSIIDTPIAFDFSHNSHVLAQNVMWSRVMQSVDGLARLLKSVEGDGGSSLWDKSLIYIATDFGRSKERPENATSFGTGHDMNNGNVLVSPLLKGNRVYGGVDPETCRTYGYDPRDGSPAPGTVMREGHTYSLIAQALDIDFAGRVDMSGLVR